MLVYAFFLWFKLPARQVHCCWDEEIPPIKLCFYKICRPLTDRGGSPSTHEYSRLEE